ncbi:MAG: TIGR01777 family protein [Caldilineaceae bacterium SB0665_bin_21]|nr:TIGR01777 family protein [Caldilineaceae bacterium SB0665_bin_21]MYA04008.1 TIGR01777 family protein [Caldilineaceae bacterium SB0664_bin_22]MYC63282.1 TIGR01777 family protein [Caldilineaceae bacterium SB0661_bin_34]
MNILIAGGTGLIGTALVALLRDRGDSVRILTRRRNLSSSDTIQYAEWQSGAESGLDPHIKWSDALVNLAGTNIGAKRWSQQRKQEILDSRVQSTGTLGEAVAHSDAPPSVFVQASAVGYYGYHPAETVLTEDAPAGSDFLAEVCQAWEAAANPLAATNVRLAIARFGVVLSPDGGALQRMLPPARMGAGGRLGSGRQPFPWIHLLDAAAAIIFLIDNQSAQGPFNVASPESCSNGEFARALARSVRRPILLFLPAFQVRLMFGEMADMLLEGQNASAQRLQDAGFEFAFGDLEAALHDLV